MVLELGKRHTLWKTINIFLLSMVQPIFLVENKDNYIERDSSVFWGWFCSLGMVLSFGMDHLLGMVLSFEDGFDIWGWPWL